MVGMNGHLSWRRYPSRLGLAAVVGLLLATMAGGAVALAITRHVAQVAENAIGYDVELEDNADDMRAAVLDLRHFHRNMLFSGPTRVGVAEFRGAYAGLLQQIAELATLGVRDPQAPQPAQLRRQAEQYFRGFRPALRLNSTDREAFIRASDTGLVRIDRLEAAAQELDRLGERRAAQAFAEVRTAENQAAAVLTALLIGLLVVAGLLAYTAVRIMGLLQQMYSTQQDLTAGLQRSLHEKADFLADVSHELRAPLTVLLGNAEVGLFANRDGPNAEIFRDIAEESARMSRLIDDLLLLARSEAKVLQLDLRPVAAEPWMAELATRAEMLARQRGAAYTTSVDCECTVRIDRDRMDQAVLVLVDNATKYAPPDKEVHLRAQAEADELLIVVSDEGPGIPEEQLPRIFQRFHRGAGPTDIQQGTGLGLAIAQSIVTAHNGRIEVNSRIGQGTSMRIRLPATSPG